MNDSTTHRPIPTSIRSSTSNSVLPPLYRGTGVLLALLLAVGPAVQPVQAQNSETPPPNFDAMPKSPHTGLKVRLTGVRSSSSSLGDVNNDGNLDLVVIGNERGDPRPGPTGSPTARLYFGDGSGEFSDANAHLTDVSDGSLSLGDVDGDNNLDLVITGEASYDKPTTKLYLGDGSWVLSEPKTGLSGVVNGSSSLGDVDNDGNLDLVVTGTDAKDYPTATLYLGDESWGFSEVNTEWTRVRYSSSSLGDVDNDGNLDLVITGENIRDEPTATLYLGDGAGGFSDAEAGLIGVSASSSSLGDVDNDGNLDLVITGADIHDEPTATLYLGDGNGGFSEAKGELAGVVLGSSSLGDVDDDGNLDLVITGWNKKSDPTTTLYLGDGTGGFREANAGLTGVVNGSSSLGDVDNDGDLDLVITGEDIRDDPTATLYLGDGSGGFSEANDN